MSRRRSSTLTQVVAVELTPLMECQCPTCVCLGHSMPHTLHSACLSHFMLETCCFHAWENIFRLKISSFFCVILKRRCHSCSRAHSIAVSLLPPSLRAVRPSSLPLVSPRSDVNFLSKEFHRLGGPVHVGARIPMRA